MNRWLEDLTFRDRLVLGAAAAAFLVVVLGALVWMPLDQRREALAERVEAQARTLAWMREAGRRVEASRASPTEAASARDGRSLLALVDATAREAGLAQTLRRAEPAGDDGVRVWLDAARYGDVAGWLESLSGEYGLAVTELALDRAGNGRVNARLTVAESGGS